MNLSELSVSDISTFMSHISRRMSKIQDRTEANTTLWEQLAFHRSCLATELQKRLNAVTFPERSKYANSSEYDRSNWLANGLSELIPVEDRWKASEVLEEHLKFFGVVKATL